MVTTISALRYLLTALWLEVLIHIHAQVKAPKKLDEKQKALLQAYAELEPGII